MCFNQAKQGCKQEDNNKNINKGHNGLYVYERQTTRVEDPETSSGIPLFDERQTNAVFCPPCGESTARSGVRGYLNKGTSFYNPPTALQATSPTRGADKSGFTLIELLVVVLIIGILAAVALPQYQKAVEKSKVAQVLSLLKTVVQAEESFYLSNGYYTSDLGKLDIELPWSGTQSFATDWGPAISNGEWSLQPNLSEIGSTTVDIVGVLRLTGEYKCAGFAYIMDSNHNTYFKSGLYCAERTGEGCIFEKNRGDYCKLFGGTYAETVIGLDLFSI